MDGPVRILVSGSAVRLPLVDGALFQGDGIGEPCLRDPGGPGIPGASVGDQLEPIEAEEERPPP